MTQDAEAIFHHPVIEVNPTIKNKYLKQIQNPMDFSTIETRIASYRNMTELQDDLILVFRNCCEYNAPRSNLFKYAM